MGQWQGEEIGSINLIHGNSVQIVGKYGDSWNTFSFMLSFCSMGLLAWFGQQGKAM